MESFFNGGRFWGSREPRKLENFVAPRGSTEERKITLGRWLYDRVGVLAIFPGYGESRTLLAEDDRR